MHDQRRVQRQPCSISARIFLPRDSSPIQCTIMDISSLGAFVRPGAKQNVPPVFDLSIGGSSLHPRVSYRTSLDARLRRGILDPVRHEVEDILIRCAFKEELLFEAISPSRQGEATMTVTRLRRTVNAIMELIEQRNAMSWQPDPVSPTSLRDAYDTLSGSLERSSQGSFLGLAGLASVKPQDGS